jgi:septal ring-binding cell division protein DamX
MMEGDVTAIDLLARLVELGRERFTGAIRFENDGIIKILYLKGGDILSASTNDRADSVDELLLRAGKVTREHVKQALAKRKESETLGDALLNLGFITRKELTWGRRVQVISVIRSVRSWTAGTYTIVADYLPKREEGTLFPLQQIVVELIVTEQERAEFERALEGGSAVFRKVADFDEHYRNLGLNEDADAVAAQIDGERSASEVASFAGRDAFNVFKLLRAFSILGLTERAGKPQPALQFGAAAGGDDLLSTAGVADGEDVWKSTVPGTVAVAAAPAPEKPPVEEFGDAPTLEIPVMASLPPDPPVRPRTVERAPVAPPPPSRRPTQARATRSVLSAPVSKKKGSRAPLLIVLVLFVLGGGGYFGWQWWQQRQQPTTSSAPARVPVQTTAKPATMPAPAATVPPPMPAPVTASAAPPTSTARAAEVRAVPKKPPSPPPAEPVTLKTTSTDRYADMAREYERTANGTYTIQFELVCQSGSLAKAIDVGGQKVWFVPITYRGQSCYRVFWGKYPTREAAALAVPSIPGLLRGPAPAIVRVP